MKTMGEYAQQYARKGWQVFPLNGKVPATPKAEGGSGCLDATTDPLIIAAWWERWPNANIGVHCGPGSGIFVLDVDSKEPKDGMTGFAALSEYESLHGALPLTLTASTPHAGRHLYFRYGRPLKNKVSVRSLDGRRTGLDVRAHGGYVVIPPSRLPAGPYAWESKGVAPVDAPDWLLDLLDPPKDTPQERRPTARPFSPSSNLERYGLKALENACSRIRCAAEGDRHNALFREAAGIGNLVAGGCLTRSHAEASLIAAGEATGKNSREVRRTVIDALTKGEGEPKRPAERMPDAPAPAHERTHEPPGAQPPPDSPSSPPSRFLPYTDAGNADRFVEHFGVDFRHCPAFAGAWLRWDGRRWVPDAMKHAMRKAREVPRLIVAEVSSDDSDGLKAARKFARATESASRLDALVRVASWDAGIAAERSAFDANPWLLNTDNCTLDLYKADAYAHRRTDLLTTLTGATWDAGSAAPTWLSFLDRIFEGDASTIAYLQRAVGYSLVGTNSEQLFFVLWGNGANGKSTFVDTLRHVFGDYAKHARAETFMMRKEGGIPNDLAALASARFVTVAETADGKALDEALIKEVTGGEPITARFLHAEFFEFLPAFTLWMSTNHKPVIKGTDHGIWRRVRLIPFNVQIPDDEQDKTLKRRLMDEAPGILKWAVEGCALWQQDGMNTPESVLAATADYRAEMDVLADFLDECCTLGALAGGTLNSDLYAGFIAWSRENGERERSHRWFTRAMQDRGFKQVASRKNGRMWADIRLDKRAASRAWGE